MKKFTLISLLSVAIVSIVNSRSFSATPAGAAPQPAASAQADLVARLPPGVAAPAVLPAGIQDPMLLAAWIGVYQQQEVIDLGEGAPVSGRGLAQYALDHNIPIVWNTGRVCGGNSCSVSYCADEHCTYGDAPGAVAPIFVRPQNRVDPPGLMSTLAHEIFHRTQPFGPVGDTRYEEYWAFQVGARVAHTEWPSFEGYHPLDPDQLNVWFRENSMTYYLQIPEYPAAVAARVYRVSGGGDPYSGLPPQFYGTPLSR
jgi:hypothetical protein